LNSHPHRKKERNINAPVAAVIVIKIHFVVAAYLRQNNIIVRHTKSNTLPIIVAVVAAMMINQPVVIAMGRIILVWNVAAVVMVTVAIVIAVTASVKVVSPVLEYALSVVLNIYLFLISK
jgi:hypothetical protein